MVIGGYSTANMSNVKPVIAGATGSVTVNSVDPDLVSKFKDTSKPLLIQNLVINANGSNIEVMGYGPHTIVAGVHTHIYGSFRISAVGDSSLQFTVG